ncbi:tryptophan-rich sensory protein [Carnobacterium viridans]|uniref:TspO/MBR family protein n=1 Tax=Carnobacterium viridans TaxID=174587 RepID=A0A1H0XR67_9LACT|nr:tryptophan-rich sensory protein [Carnobacterium viridans]UDE95596.1 tryptophan-rich sensory protein [Carnobacterium viridans]SDQ05319.1 TspO/MBR family protein [Carnobacterium viridans]
MTIGKQIILYLAYGIMITVNALANILPINGYQTGEISDTYEVFFTPAGFIFSIWGVIYFALLLWLLSFSFKKQTLSSGQFWGFLLTCLLNTSWILIWHFLLDGIAFIVIFLLLLSLIFLYQAQKRTTPSKLYLIPISLYLGWIIVATITNFSYWLVASIGIEVNLQTIVTYVLLSLATLLGLGIAYFFKDWAIILVFIWAMYGIVTKNLPDHQSIAIVTAGLTVILILGSIISFFLNRKTAKKNPYHF